MKHFLILIFTFILSVGHTETIKIAVSGLNPYADPDYENRGVLIELTNAAFKALDKKTEFHYQPWKRAMATLSSGWAQAAMPYSHSFSNIPESNIILSETILPSKSYAFYLRDKREDSFKSKKLDELSKKLTAGTIRGVNTDILLASNFKDVRTTKDNETLIKMLMHGRVDFAVMDLLAGWNTIRKHYPNEVDLFETQFKSVSDGTIHLVGKKDSNVVSDFNEGLAKIKRSGTFDKIISKYHIDSLFQKNVSNINRKKIGLLIDIAGLGDKGFSDMQFDGLIAAKWKYNIDFRIKSPDFDDERSRQKAIEDLVKQGCDLIIVGGAFNFGPLQKVAPLFPETNFIILDGVIKGNNITSASFSQKQGAFLVGALAAKVTKTKKVAMIGGVDVPVIKDFANGFNKGVSHVGSKIKSDIFYVSKYPDYSGFSNIEKGKQLAVKVFDQGYDIIFSVAGGVGLGIIEVAKEKGKYAIGVDTDQDYLAKGHVITSMVKRLDLAVYNLIGHFVNGTMKTNYEYIYNIKNGGVDITDMNYVSELVGDKTKNELSELKDKISNNKISIE